MTEPLGRRRLGEYKKFLPNQPTRKRPDWCLKEAGFDDNIRGYAPALVNHVPVVVPKTAFSQLLHKVFYGEETPDQEDVVADEEDSSDSDSSSETNTVIHAPQTGEKPDPGDSKQAKDRNIDELTDEELELLLEEFGIDRDDPRITRTETFGPTEPATQPALTAPVVAPSAVTGTNEESPSESGIFTKGTTHKAESSLGRDERSKSPDEERDTPTPENLPDIERPNALELGIRQAETKQFQNTMEEFSLKTITLADVPVQVEAMRRATMEELKSMYFYMTGVKPKKVAHAVLYQDTRQTMPAFTVDSSVHSTAVYSSVHCMAV